VALCVLAIVANTVSMAVSERAPEIAILKALGFRRRVIFATLLAEAALLSLAAGAAGVGLSLVLTVWLRSAVVGWSPALGPLARFVVTPGVAAQGLVLGVLIGVVSGVVPAFGAARRSVTATLREAS